MKRKFFLFLVLISFLSFFNSAFAEDVRTVNLIIRDHESIVFSGTVNIPDGGTVDLNDNVSSSHSINAESVLAILNVADTTSDNFNISNLQYYSSFNSLYLKCINSTATGEKCDNWQYAVNSSYPSVSMDQNVLSGGETVYVFFGSQYRVRLSGSGNITTADSLIVSSEKYNYENNAWEGRTGVTIGLTQPNPDDPWTPREVETSAVDGDGKAAFSSIAEGSYNVGVKEDFYFPTESLNVTTFSFSGGGAVGDMGASAPAPVQKPKFDLDQAFKFMLEKQKENGSFGEDLYTDWAALALAGDKAQEGTIKLIKYLDSSKITSGPVTDYERRAMALMALGLNPYATNGVDYIEKIIADFDGNQFGDKELVNDDIFAVLVLTKAGYTKEEDVIKNTVAYILSKQKNDGSWEGSVDMTAAAIQALTFLKDSEQVKSSIAKAKEFLQDEQKESGGWENVSSTAWAIGGIYALGELDRDWSNNGNTPTDFLATKQNEDGGINNELEQNRLWETAYAITALSDKTWSEIMQNFDKKPVELTAMKTKEGNQIAKSPKKITKVKQITTKMRNKIQINSKQNMASVISAAEGTQVKEKERKSWFRSVLGRIFGW